MPNPICHWELMVDDVARSRAFYGKVFDWRFEIDPGNEYTMIHTGREPGGGMMARPPMAPTAALNTYVEVATIDGTLPKVIAAGGMVIVPKTEIPGVGWFAMFVDLDRIPIGIFETRAAATDG